MDISVTVYGDGVRFHLATVRFGALPKENVHNYLLPLLLLNISLDFLTNKNDKKWHELYKERDTVVTCRYGGLHRKSKNVLDKL